MGQVFVLNSQREKVYLTLERIGGTAKILHTMAIGLIHIEGKALYFFF